MLKFENLSLSRGPKELLNSVTFTINNGQKIGVTGENGAGKSSLLALILEELHADSGHLQISGVSSIAHVAQDSPYSKAAALDYVLEGDTELQSIHNKISQAQKNDNGRALAELYSDMERIDGYTANSRAASILHGLGFSSEQEKLAVDTFSGGWQMRLNLAQALMCRSDLLLLDEPTNHLDLDAVLWVEEWLRSYDGTLLLISHDRDFLDNTVSHIAHIEQMGVKLYTGNYSAFEVQRSQAMAVHQATYAKQQREIAHIHKFVNKFKAKATKAKQAQSRIKALERMELISQAHVESPFHFSFPVPDKIPDQLISLDSVELGYTDTILQQVKLLIHAGDRIGLLGPNGAGKSTLIKHLAGIIEARQGEVSVARDLNIGYFAQHQIEQLDSHASPILHLQRLYPQAAESELRSFLGGFAFSGDMATNAIAAFSGGEKARLVLALLVYQKPNLLLLDEPTNHLDLEMRYALSVALQSYEGALVVVSHDRHLLRITTNKLLLVANNSVCEFDGDLDDYGKWLQTVRKTEIPSGSTIDKTANNRKLLRQQAAQQRKAIQPLRNKINQIEKRMAVLNGRKKNIEEQLGDTVTYAEDNKTLLKNLIVDQSAVQSELNELENEWLILNEELDNYNTAPG